MPLRDRTPLTGWNDLDPTETGTSSRLRYDQKREYADIDYITREVSDKVGMGGSLGSVSTGGIVIGPGLGVAVYEAGVIKTRIEPDGDLFVGSNIGLPENMSFGVFANAQPYNGEEMEEGDILIGDNTDETSNVKFDAREGQLQFRYGQTVKAYMDTDGSLKWGEGVGELNETGMDIEQAGTANESPSQIRWRDDSNNITFVIYDYEASGVSNAVIQKNRLAGGPTAGAQFKIDNDDTDTGPGIVLASLTTLDQASIYIGLIPGLQIKRSSGVYSWVINEDGADMDGRIEGDTDANLTVWDAGLDAVGMGGAAESGYKLKVHGKVNLPTGNTYDINGSPHTHSYLASDADYTDISANDAATDVTGAELEELTDGSETTLHSHAGSGGFTQEQIEDFVGAMFDGFGSGGVAATYDDANNRVVVDGGDLQTSLSNHVAENVDAHDASAISVVDSGGYFSGTDVEAVLQEIGEELGASGWIAAEPETWTYASADDPVYQIYVSGDVTSNVDYKVGNKVKCTNNSTTFYGIIVKVGSYDGGNNRTPIDIYGGTDYDLVNSAITATYISKAKSPDGFPMSPLKWTVEATTTSSASQASPSAGTVYNIGGLSLAVPIGAWMLSFTAVTWATLGSSGQQASVQGGLGTANNTLDAELKYYFVSNSTSVIAHGGTGSKHIVLTSKTTYYLNHQTGTSGLSNLQERGDIVTSVIRAVCAYL